MEPVELGNHGKLSTYEMFTHTNTLIKKSCIQYTSVVFKNKKFINK